MGVPFGFMMPKVILRKQLWEELYPYCSCKFIFPCCYSVTRSCLTLCDSVDCSPPGSSVPGISQAIILEWIAISFTRGPPGPRDQISLSYIGTQTLYHWATREGPEFFPNIDLQIETAWFSQWHVSFPYLKDHLKSGNTLISKCCSATMALRGKPIPC